MAASSDASSCNAQQRKRHPWHFQKPNERGFRLISTPSRCHEPLILLVTDQRPDHAYAAYHVRVGAPKVVSPWPAATSAHSSILSTKWWLQGVPFWALSQCLMRLEASPVASKPFSSDIKVILQAVVCSVWFGFAS